MLSEDINIAEISDLVITTNTMADLSRIRVGGIYMLSDMLDIYKVVELLPGCRDKGCGFRHFRAEIVEMNDGVQFEYLEKGASMIHWERYNPEDYFEKAA